MLNVGSTAGSRCEVWLDAERNRVMILADHLFPFYLTAEEAEALAENLAVAVRDLRRLREERG